MLVEIHMIQNHAPSNLNRDDTGSPKDCLFGEIPRARISSQCIKRSIRRSTIFQEEMKDIPMGMRTRLLPVLVKDELLKRGVAVDLAEVAAKKATGFGTKEGTERDEMNTAQIMFLSPADVKLVADVLHEAIKKNKTKEAFEKVEASALQKEAGKRGWTPITPDIALFGRMITSDAFLDIQASMQVAHAISTNKVDNKFDYFTAVDDQKGVVGDTDDLGAGMIGDVEFNSACYYKYFSLDTDAFVANLIPKGAGKDQIATTKEVLKKTVRAFLKAAIFTTPTGKQNTFAAHQLPDAILVEVRPQKIPVSYANAFIEPARPRDGRNLVQESIQKLVTHAELLQKKFSLSSAARLWFTTTEIVLSGAETCETIDHVLDKLEAAL